MTALRDAGRSNASIGTARQDDVRSDSSVVHMAPIVPLKSGFYQAALETAPDGIVVVDAAGVIHFVNRQTEILFGWTREEMIGQTVEMLVPARVRDIHPAHRGHYFASSQTRPMAATLVLTAAKADGTEFPVDISLSPLETEDGLWVSAAIRDTTVRKEAESELREAYDKLASTVADLERQRHELAIVSEMGDMLQSCLSTAEAYEIMTTCADELFPSTTGIVYRPTSHGDLEAVSSWGVNLDSAPFISSEDCWALRRGRLHRSSGRRVGYLCRHEQGRATRWALCLPLLAHGEVLGLLLMRDRIDAQGADGELRHEDVERLAVTVGEHLSLGLANLKLSENLRIQSQRDPLTAVYNRRRMDEVLDHEAARALREMTPLSMLLLDIDDFKVINDSEGHAAGDVRLRSLARLLLASTRGEDVVCRLGGDEFAVILPDVDIETAVQRAEVMRAKAEGTLNLTLSIGVSGMSPSITTPAHLIDACDRSMYDAKDNGKNLVGPAIVERVTLSASRRRAR